MNRLNNSTNGSEKLKRKIRCAIYTRKSTDENLNTDFNSLDAQRESCEAFIQSMRPEGWVQLTDRYDDAAFSGSNMERPAIQRLMAAVASGDVDCIVVYKLDRLSRSLLDFTKIIEFLDEHEVSFVSVTQQFNTSTPMGKLTLNILMSFAQFEREVIGERIRDKVGAARRRGKYMGGVPPLGYDVDHENKKLVVNTGEVELVRYVFKQFLKIQSMTALAKKLNEEGYTTKSWIGKNGKARPPLCQYE